MASLPSTSLVRVGLLTSFACQSLAKRRRSGRRRSRLLPHRYLLRTIQSLNHGIPMINQTMRGDNTSQYRLRSPIRAYRGASKLKVGLIVARPRSSAGPRSHPSFFWFGIPFRGRGPSNVEDDFESTYSTRRFVPGDHLLALFH
jgi:hypothetical protein